MNKPTFGALAILGVRSKNRLDYIPVQFAKQLMFGAVLEHQALGVGKDQACHVVVDIRPIARVEVAAACREGAVVGRHAACLALADIPNMEGRLG